MDPDELAVQQANLLFAVEFGRMMRRLVRTARSISYDPQRDITTVQLWGQEPVELVGNPEVPEIPVDPERWQRNALLPRPLAPQRRRERRAGHHRRVQNRGPPPDDGDDEPPLPGRAAA
jgi:hypothetical protein